MSTRRVFDFNPRSRRIAAGSAQQAQAEMLDYKGTGMSVMEISHRSRSLKPFLADCAKTICVT